MPTSRHTFCCALPNGPLRDKALEWSRVATTAVAQGTVFLELWVKWLLEEEPNVPNSPLIWAHLVKLSFHCGRAGYTPRATCRGWDAPCLKEGMYFIIIIIHCEVAECMAGAYALLHVPFRVTFHFPVAVLFVILVCSEGNAPNRDMPLQRGAGGSKYICESNIKELHRRTSTALAVDDQVCRRLPLWL